MKLVLIRVRQRPAALETAIGPQPHRAARPSPSGCPPDAHQRIAVGAGGRGRSLIGSYLGSAVPARATFRGFVALWRPTGSGETLRCPRRSPSTRSA